MNEKYTVSSLRAFLLSSSKEVLSEKITQLHPVDILEVLHEYEEDNQVILDRLSDDIIAELMDFEEDEDKYELLTSFSNLRQKHILEEMSSDEIIGLVSNLDENEKQDVLNKMSVDDRAEVNEILSYKEDSAGFLMATEFISIRENKTILKTLEYLHGVVDDAEMVYYLYVIDKPGHLKGVVSLRDIVASNFETKIFEITNTHVESVHVDDDQEKVANVFAKYGYLMLPVVDDENIIRGIITVDDVLDIIHEETTEDIHRLAGLDEEEKIDGTLKNSIKSRLPWLSMNLITALCAASVVTYFASTIEQVVALASISPIITNMGGNAGTQALTLTVRGIALGELTGKNAARVFFKELGVGIICGIALGFAIGIGCYFFFGNFTLGLVASIAMISNLIIATVFGFTIPQILNKLKIDPALASSIFVTTATDVFGFLVFLGLATLALPYLS